MRIVDVKAYIAESELIKPLRIAYAEIRSVESIYVRIVTDEGIDGWGEVAPTPKITGETLGTALASIKFMRDLIRGLDPLEFKHIWSIVESNLLHNYSAKAGVINAVLDAAGKYLSLPVYRLFGGSYRDIVTDVTISLDEPKAMSKEALEWVNKGFRKLKLKLGGPLEKDIERVKAVRDAVGSDIELRVDANQAWSLKSAVRAVNALARYDVIVVEQPLHRDDFKSLSHLRKLSPIPVVLDESVHNLSDAVKAIHYDAGDGVNIKIAKAGGVIGGLEIANLAKAFNLKLMAGCMAETSLGIASAIHMILSSSTPFNYIDLDADLFLKTQPVTEGFERVKDVIRIKDVPGLGIKVNLSKLREVDLNSIP